MTEPLESRLDEIVKLSIPAKDLAISFEELADLIKEKEKEALREEEGKE